MKLSTLVLAGSVAVNAVLFALYFAGPSGDSAAPVPTAVAVAAKAPATTSNSAIDAETWAKLQTDDLPGMLERLRAEGFPPALIRAIMAEQVRVQFAPRRAALNRTAGNRPYWEPATNDPQTEAALRAIMKEQNQALKDLLGPEANADEAGLALLHRQFPNWSDEKLAAIQQTQQALNEKAQEALTSGGAAALNFATLEKERHAEIAKLLTPQELEDYDFRTSTTASLLRNQLAAFDPSEQEFRALFQLQQPFDEQYRLNLVLGSLSGEDQRQAMQQRSEAQKLLTEQIKAALGDQRYADYQRSIDGNYQQTTRLVARLELPPESANQVYAVQQDLQQRVQAMQSLPPADRNVQLATLSAEAQTRITATLGPRGYDAYKQYGGQWLQQLQPRPIPAPRFVPVGGRGGGG